MTVDGPTAYERERNDGTLVEWDLMSLEGGDPGTRLPFLIADRTPRERRVRPTVDPATSPLRGFDTVVVGVPDLATAADAFATAFDAREPTRTTCADLRTDVASSPDLPVALAEPTGDGWLAERVSRTGAPPAAYLIGCERGADHGLETLDTASIGDQSVAWLPVTHPVGHPYLGTVLNERSGPLRTALRLPARSVLAGVDSPERISAVTS